MLSSRPYRLSTSHSKRFWAPPGTCDMRRVESWANTIRPTATIQVTTIEFVIGKPNGLAISTAFCDRPCCAGSRSPRQRMSSTCTAMAPPQHGACHRRDSRAQNPEAVNPCHALEDRVAPRTPMIATPPVFRMFSAMSEPYQLCCGRRIAAIVRRASTFQPLGPDCPRWYACCTCGVSLRFRQERGHS